GRRGRVRRWHRLALDVGAVTGEPGRQRAGQQVGRDPVIGARHPGQRPGVRRPADALDQHRPWVALTYFDRTRPRRGRVVGLLDEQYAREPRTFDVARRARAGGPVAAGRVEPGVVPGQERRGLVERPVVLGPFALALRPPGIGALHRQVIGIAV